MTNTTTIKAILAAGGIRAERAGDDFGHLVESGLVEFLTGPAHGPRGTYYATARGCRLVHDSDVPMNYDLGDVNCPDCCPEHPGVQYDDGDDGCVEVPCAMCDGKGFLTAEEYGAEVGAS